MAANSSFTRILSPRTRRDKSASRSARNLASAALFIRQIARRMYSAREILRCWARRPLSDSSSSGNFSATVFRDVSWRYLIAYLVPGIGTGYGCFGSTRMIAIIP